MIHHGFGKRLEYIVNSLKNVILFNKFTYFFNQSGFKKKKKKFLLKLLFLFIDFLYYHSYAVYTVGKQTTAIDHCENRNSQLKVVMRNDVTVPHGNHRCQTPINREHVKMVPFRVI